MKQLCVLISLLAVGGLLAGCSINKGVNSISSTANAEANKPPTGLEPVNKNDAGLAVSGYDTVAYFQEGKPVKGSEQFTYEWMGAKWYFNSAENRDLFMKEPGRYAPQFGGYCSWAVAHGYTANADPTAWKIINDKLYLNYNDKVKQRWEQDEPTYIKQADDNFPQFLIKKPEHKG